MVFSMRTVVFPEAGSLFHCHQSAVQTVNHRNCEALLLVSGTGAAQLACVMSRMKHRRRSIQSLVKFPLRRNFCFRRDKPQITEMKPPNPPDYLTSMASLYLPGSRKHERTERGHRCRLKHIHQTPSACFVPEEAGRGDTEMKTKVRGCNCHTSKLPEPHTCILLKWESECINVRTCARAHTHTRAAFLPSPIDPLPPAPCAAHADISIQ